MHAARYANVQATTASRERLMVLLFQAATRHLLLAASALDHGRSVDARTSLARVHDIVTQLMVTLDHRAAPELCEQLTDVYTAVLVHITRAMLRADPQDARNAYRILAPVAQGFEEAVANLAGGKP
jgi:flagellar protein FliS